MHRTPLIISVAQLVMIIAKRVIVLILVRPLGGRVEGPTRESMSSSPRLTTRFIIWSSSLLVV